MRFPIANVLSVRQSILICFPDFLSPSIFFSASFHHVARKPPGFAFVEFEDPRDADVAIGKLDGELCRPPYSSSDLTLSIFPSQNIFNPSEQRSSSVLGLQASRAGESSFQEKQVLEEEGVIAMGIEAPLVEVELACGVTPGLLISLMFKGLCSSWVFDLLYFKDLHHLQRRV